MKRVLIVDDNETVALSLAIAIGRLPHIETVVRFDPAAALEVIRQWDGEREFAALVTDYNLPRLNGLELIERVRTMERYRTLPAIMITAGEDAMDLNGNLLGTPNAVFQKPFSMREVCRVLEQLLI
jgi:CheY-like chemotaxis protein